MNKRAAKCTHTGLSPRVIRPCVLRPVLSVVQSSASSCLVTGCDAFPHSITQGLKPDRQSKDTATSAWIFGEFSPKERDDLEFGVASQENVILFQTVDLVFVDGEIGSPRALQVGQDEFPVAISNDTMLPTHKSIVLQRHGALFVGP